MKKPVLTVLLIVSIAPLLVHCASQTDVEDLRYQLRIVNKKLEDMKANTVGQLQKRQAASAGQVDVLEQDILKLKSQLDETYHLNQRLKEQNKELQESISTVAAEEAAKREEALRRLEEQQLEKEAKLANELNEKLRMQQESVKAIQEARIKEAERKAKEAALAAQLAKNRSAAMNSSTGTTGTIQQIPATDKKIKKSVVAPAAPPEEREDDANTPQQTASSQPVASPQVPPATITIQTGATTLAKAQSLYDSSKYDEALVLYEEVAVDPTSGDAVTARFMMGECLFNQKEYDKAIMQYQKIISQHPDDAKAAPAMLKQGMAFEKLADKDTAKVIYKKLLKKHGSAPEAAIAQEKLDKL
ncbi:MAG: tetratricopeptide repeat protein [Desulforhopalus sp.]